MEPLRALLLLALLLALPVAAAAPATVDLTESDGRWNGLTRVDADAAGLVELWVPQGARIQAVEADGGPARWTSKGDTGLVVQAEGAGVVEARYDFRERPPTLAHWVTPAGVDALTLHVTPADGRAPSAADAVFTRADRTHTATFPGLAAGDAITVRLVDPGRVGELPLLATVAALSLAVLLGAMAWHSVRPPLEGRPPQKFLEHLAELQARLIPPGLVFGILNVVYFTTGLRIVDVGPWSMPAPTLGVEGSVAARAFESFAARLVPPDVQLVVLRPADAVLAQIGMCLFLAFVTVLPLLVYEISAFIAPGLEARERRVAFAALPPIVVLFLVGVTLGYTLMAPLMIRTLYSYAPGIGATPLLGVNDLVGFALLVILVFGLAFEIPVVMYALARFGIVGWRTFGKYVRHALLAIVILAGLLTPDPSVVSQLLLAVPLGGLYVLGIGAAALGSRSRKRPA